MQRVESATPVEQVLGARIGRDEGVDVRAGGGWPTMRCATDILGDPNRDAEKKRNLSPRRDVGQTAVRQRTQRTSCAASSAPASGTPR